MAQRTLRDPLLYGRASENLIHPDCESVTCDDDAGEQQGP
jgi:hypothetical protein